MLQDQLTQLLTPIAEQFKQLPIPEVITHWGHPVMMGTVIFFMGSFVAYSGWQGRLSDDAETDATGRDNHRKLAPWMFLFLALGYTGGLLSLVMQGHPILESSHFWTGTIALGLLAVTASISLVGFGGEQKVGRTIHAYLGAGIMTLLVVHTVFGVQLGLSF